MIGTHEQEYNELKKYLGICLIISIIVLTVIVGCASFIKTSYVTLATSQELYYQAKEAARDLYAQGLIDEETKVQINEAANVYKAAHNVAKSALEVYAVTNDAADKDRARVAIVEASLRWLDVAKLINAIKPGLVPESLGGGL